MPLQDRVRKETNTSFGLEEKMKMMKLFKGVLPEKLEVALKKLDVTRVNWRLSLKNWETAREETELVQAKLKVAALVKESARLEFVTAEVEWKAELGKWNGLVEEERADYFPENT